MYALSLIHTLTDRMSTLRSVEIRFLFTMQIQMQARKGTTREIPEIENNLAF